MEVSGENIRAGGNYRCNLSVDCSSLVLSGRGPGDRFHPGVHTLLINLRSGEPALQPETPPRRESEARSVTRTSGSAL